MLFYMVFNGKYLLLNLECYQVLKHSLIMVNYAHVFLKLTAQLSQLYIKYPINTEMRSKVLVSINHIIIHRHQMLQVKIWCRSTDFSVCFSFLFFWSLHWFLFFLDFSPNRPPGRVWWIIIRKLMKNNVFLQFYLGQARLIFMVQLILTVRSNMQHSPQNSTAVLYWTEKRRSQWCSLLSPITLCKLGDFWIYIP